MKGSIIKGSHYSLLPSGVFLYDSHAFTVKSHPETVSLTLHKAPGAQEMGWCSPRAGMPIIHSDTQVPAQFLEDNQKILDK